MLSHRKMSHSHKSSECEATIQEETTSIVPNHCNQSAPNGKADVHGDTNCLPPTLSAATVNAKVSVTCNFGDLPSWMQDNRDILRGYRRPTFSYVKCARSLFYLHNESVNIWSHLLGSAAFIVIAFTTYFYVLSHTHTAKWTDFIVFYLFLAGAMVCLGFSSLFHTFCCHSEKVCANWNRCDYVGIVTLIVGSFYPMIYYGFYCHTTLQIVYLTMISVFGIATIFVAVSSYFRTPQFRWFRTSLFLAMGLSAVFPIVHAVLLYGFHLCWDVLSLKYMLLMGTLYVVGALIYGTRVPERLYPGKFDIWGSSHQIFHCFVVSAALVHYYGVTKAMVYWHDENHACGRGISEMTPR